MTPGSAADLGYQIQSGEELLSINGVNLHWIRSNVTVQALLETRHNGVELVLAPMHRVSIMSFITLIRNTTSTFHQS